MSFTAKGPDHNRRKHKQRSVGMTNARGLWNPKRTGLASKGRESQSVAMHEREPASPPGCKGPVLCVRPAPSASNFDSGGRGNGGGPPDLIGRYRQGSLQDPVVALKKLESSR